MNKQYDVAIYEVIDNNEKIRVYEVDGGWHSAIYINEDKRNELIFPYMKKTASVFSKKVYRDVLMLGGGMFSFARHVLSNYLDTKVDVVEIDEMAINTAREYFFLDEFEKEFNLEGSDRFNVYIEDAKVFLEVTDGKYDFIFNDTYLGTSVVSSIVSMKYLKETKRHMNENAVYVANLPGKKNIKKSYLLMDTIHNLQKLFKNVYLISARGDMASDILMNYIVVASDDNLDIEDTIAY